MEYDLELERVKKEIKKSKAKKAQSESKDSAVPSRTRSTRVCLQLPDGLKPKATEIAAQLEKETSAKILIWAGSNFGACDIPLQVEKLGVDLLINFGHAQFKR